MKKLIHSIIALMLSATVFAQAPQSFKYQAVARDASGEVIANQQVSFQISILQGSESGTTVYTETHVDSTNQFGLVTLEIGTGTTTDDFTAIDWGNDTYFIQVEMDATGGTSYTLMGTSQLLSVPYALHATTAESASSYTETDPLYSGSQAANITATDITNLGNLSGTNTGDQDLSSLTTQSALEDTATAIRADIPDVSGFISNETDPVYTVSEAANISATDIENLDNLSGTNTGDQDLSAVLSQSNSANAQIKNLTDPTDAQDAVTKAYVDDIKAQIEELQIAAGIKVGDIEGNVYNTVKIGTQKWMSENLLSTKYFDGTEIEGIYNYDNDPDLINKNGLLYTWEAVMNGEPQNNDIPSGVQGVCPSGWHLPSQAEFDILINFLGGEIEADNKLRTINWGTNSTNESGFSAIPTGYYNTLSEAIIMLTSYASYWTTTISGDGVGFTIHESFLGYSSSGSAGIGRSVRCIKD